MDGKIARLNIEHFRKRLATETDETTRQILLRLLAEEEAKLVGGTHGRLANASITASPSHPTRANGLAARRSVVWFPR